MKIKIGDIFEKFKIPPNLQEHMLRVYEVVNFIEKHWKQKGVNWNLVKKLALLHDLGNIVKFNLNKHPEFLGSEQNNVERWKNIQKEIIKKYGSDAEETTKKMLGEIGIDKKTVSIIYSKSFIYSVKIRNSSNWYLKILYYADLRTLPLGVGTLKERLVDLAERYSIPDFKNLASACFDIERQVQRNLDVDTSKITNDVIKVDKNILIKLTT